MSNHEIGSPSNVVLPAPSVIWAPGEGGVMTHMVFGLTVSKQGTILAFTEARIHYSDDGPHHIVMKRSIDGGDTWEAVQFIETSREGECWANPTALSDRISGKLFVFYALNAHNISTRMFYKVSTDDGMTWSERVEVTELLQEHNLYGWTLFLPGPGHGIQLRDGRLVLQYWGRKSIALPQAERNYGNGVLYSDDHGITWQAGGIVPLDHELGNNEARIVERENGELYLNARANGFRHRVISVSKDRGITWSSPYFNSVFPARWGCDSGLVKWTDNAASETPVWLYSTIKEKRPEPHNALEISVSYDEGESWPIRKDVFTGPCNYSDLAVMPDRSIIVLIGAGAYEHSPGFAKEALLVRIPLHWLTD